MAPKILPNYLQKLKKYLDQLTVSRFKTIAKHLLEKEDLSLRQILDSLPAEIKPLFENLYFESQKNQIDSVARLSEIKKAINNINNILLKDKLNQIKSIKYLNLSQKKMKML